MLLLSRLGSRSRSVSGVCTPIIVTPLPEYFWCQALYAASLCRQLMQPKVQKCSTTTCPRSSESFSGRELSHSSLGRSSSSGALALSTAGAACWAFAAGTVPAKTRTNAKGKDRLVRARLLRGCSLRFLNDCIPAPDVLVSMARRDPESLRQNYRIWEKWGQSTSCKSERASGA